MSSTESTALPTSLNPDGAPLRYATMQRRVVDRVQQLIVGADLPALVVDRHLSLRRVGVGGRDRRAHLFEADAVLVQHRRVQFDADRRQRAAADRHLADAAHLRRASAP